MFTPADRAALLEELVSYARADDSVTAAALVGSAARGATDSWSDIDLALRLRPGLTPLEAAERWSAGFGALREAADHFDIRSGPALYRVFLLSNSLQVDLSFWPADSFGSNGEPFALIFGAANPAEVAGQTDLRGTIGWAWLYALHIRSALARGRAWQADQMLNGLRDQIITLACVRHDLPASNGRGVDDLPVRLRTALARTLVSEPDSIRLSAAFRTAVEMLLVELAAVEPGLAVRLQAPLRLMVQDCQWGPAP